MTFDFFYDLGSPYSYLAATQLAGIESRTGAAARLLPVTLGGIRKTTGHQLPPPQQLLYMAQDTHRWAGEYGVPMRIPTAFPTKTIQALAALDHAGLDGKALLALSETQEVKDALRRNTDLALARGVFGVPTFFVGERSFWGNDRLHFVEAELKR